MNVHSKPQVQLGQSYRILVFDAADEPRMVVGECIAEAGTFCIRGDAPEGFAAGDEIRASQPGWNIEDELDPLFIHDALIEGLRSSKNR
jgi:hypothetical protein